MLVNHTFTYLFQTSFLVPHLNIQLPIGHFCISWSHFKFNILKIQLFLFLFRLSATRVPFLSGSSPKTCLLLLNSFSDFNVSILISMDSTFQMLLNVIILSLFSPQFIQVVIIVFFRNVPLADFLAPSHVLFLIILQKVSL